MIEVVRVPAVDQSVESMFSISQRICAKRTICSVRACATDKVVSQTQSAVMEVGCWVSCRFTIQDPVDHLGGELEDLFRIPEQASEKRLLLLSLLQALPLQIGELFDQLFHFLLVLDCLPYAFFPLPRHKHLAQFSSLPSDQVETSMELSLGAATTRFATADVSDGEGAAQKTGLVDDLGQARATSSLAIGDLRAGHRASIP